MMGSNSSESLNGLKFGKKIYFEDAGVGVQAKSGTGSSSVGGLQPPPPAKKKERLVGGVVQGGGQPPRCQVEGCKVDLSDVKAYYSRHKVCIMHSKSQKVIVSGLEQRFCQQCSRFHQLPEFDNGKRSCRRRLAGHNERRRKPPPGSLLSTRFGTYSSSVFENNSGTGGFLMDFTKCPRVTLMDQWSPARASEKEFGNQPPVFGKFIPTPCHSNSESHPPQLQGSVNGTHYPGPGIPSGGCFAGVSSDSSCALSLLSNQPCGSRNQSSSSLGANYLLDTDNNAHVVQPAVTNGVNINHFSSSSWGLKGNSETETTYLNMYPGGGLAQISHPGNSQYTGDLQLTQQRGRQVMVPENSRASYDSSAQHKHWSL